MSGITIYYYTAWNGYSWQGCGASTAASLQRYMEAAGVLPGTPGRNPPFGGAIACQVDDEMGVAVYRCGIREKGDAFGRDSLFIALSFVPLEAGPVDIASVLSLQQMWPSDKGELSPVSVPLSAIASSGVARRIEKWHDESFSTRLSGIAGLREASTLFFGRSCQLGLLQASVALETNSLEDASVSLSYRVFPEVSAFAEASRAYADARRLSRGALPSSHPLAMKLCDAASQLQTVRIDKMPGYTGLADYLAERNAEFGGIIASAPAKVRGDGTRQSDKKAGSPSRRGERPPTDRPARRSLFPYLLAALMLAVTGVVIALLIAKMDVIDSQDAEIKQLRQINTQQSNDNEYKLRNESNKAREANEGIAKLRQDVDRQKEELEKLRQENQELKSAADQHKTEYEDLLASAKTARDEAKKHDDKLASDLKDAENKYHKLMEQQALSLNSYISNLYSFAERLNLRQEVQKARTAQNCGEKCIEVERLYMAAFEKAFRQIINEKDAASKVQVYTQTGTLQKPAIGADVERNAKHSAGNDDASEHSGSYFSSCKCWRCKEAEKLKNDAEKLKDPLADCLKAREEAKKVSANPYAKSAYDKAESQFGGAYSDDVNTYIRNLKSAKAAFETAKKQAKANKSSQQVSRQSAQGSKPSTPVPQSNNKATTQK